MLIAIDILESSDPITPENITHHKVPIGDMKLELQAAWGISLELVSPNRKNYIIEAWSCEEKNALEEAKEKYNKILAKLQKGEYILHLYDNGNVELELKEEKPQEKEAK